METATLHLHKTDSNPERGACLLAVLYLQTNRPHKAETILTQYLEKHQASGIILTNLAKAQSALGDKETSLNTLWKALQLDPNQDNGLTWFEAIHHEQGGEISASDALQRIAGIPLSWRAQIGLARYALDQQDLLQAQKWYHDAINQAPKPLPTDLLKQMSGDLGQRGYLIEAINLTTPHYQATLHGLDVGNNLIKANLDSGQLDQVRMLLRELHQQQRPDWKPHLDFWENELSKLEIATVPPISLAELKISILEIEGPIWLKSSSHLATHFPRPKKTSPRVVFLGSSFEENNHGMKDLATMQPSNNPGRMCRAWPLLLSECCYLSGKMQTSTRIPWSVQGSFVVSGARQSDENLIDQARGKEGQLNFDYIVASHLITRGENWTLQLRLLRAIDAKCLAQFNYNTAEMQFHPHSNKILNELFDALSDAFDQSITLNSSLLLSGSEFDHYLFCLEQCLATTCNALEETQNSFLSNAADILNGMLQLCLQNPNHTPSRLLLLRTVKALEKKEPEILQSFRNKLTTLMIDYPLPEPFQKTILKELQEISDYPED